MDQIRHALSVGNAGGVRVSIGNQGRAERAVILTSLPSARQAKENPYHDRIENNVLVYTGSGREGDQSLGGVNKRLPEQLVTNFPIYAFTLIGSRRDATIGPQRWRFLGLIQYLSHHADHQVDVRGDVRRVWVFEFRVYDEPNEILVEQDHFVSDRLISEADARDEDSQNDREIVTAEERSDTERGGQESTQVEAVRGRLLAVSPERFEHLIKDVLVATGMEDVAVTKYSQDGGIDINAKVGMDTWPIRNLLVQIQAKRWLHSVGRKDVANLRGSLQPYARGTLVTTSYFSKAAMNEANEKGKNPIVLIDGHSFASIVQASSITLD